MAWGRPLNLRTYIGGEQHARHLCRHSGCLSSLDWAHSLQFEFQGEFAPSLFIIGPLKPPLPPHLSTKFGCPRRCPTMSNFHQCPSTIEFSKPIQSTKSNTESMETSDRFCACAGLTIR